MPIYHQGRKVKEVWHQGRKVKEVWHMGRLIYTALNTRGFEVFLDQMDYHTRVSSIGDVGTSVAVSSGKKSQLHMLAGASASLTVSQGTRRALHMEVYDNTIYAESTSPNGQRVVLNGFWPGGTHTVTLSSTANGLSSTAFELLVDGSRVATATNSGNAFSPQSVFDKGYAVINATGTAAWGFHSAESLTGTWTADALRPGAVSWRTVDPNMQLLVPGGEVMAWAYSGGDGGSGGGNTFSGGNGADGNGALIDGFTLDMIGSAVIGEGGRGGGGSTSMSGNKGKPGYPTTVGEWFTTATATTRPTPQAWGETYKGSIPGAGGSGGSRGYNDDSGSSGSAGKPGGLIIARRWP